MSKEKNEVGLKANQFIKRLKLFQSPKELEKIKRYFKSDKGEYSYGDKFIGVQMGKVFSLAKEFMGMPLEEVEKLLENSIHEVRAGAVSIMDFQARDKKTSDLRRKELFELYLRRHDRINNWDLVDRSALFVIGSYLLNKPRNILYKLARSKNIWERRTAIVSTGYFLRQGDISDTFRIAEILANDKADLINKAVGGWIREAGKQDAERLYEFLDEHAAKMPRVSLRYAIEKLSLSQRKKYLAMVDISG